MQEILTDSSYGAVTVLGETGQRPAVIVSGLTRREHQGCGECQRCVGSDSLAHGDDFFRAMAQARVDHSIDKTFRAFLAPDLLILDDLGLHRLTQQQSIDLYELVIARRRTSSFVVTSNRAVDEWLGLFDDPILGNSALNRLANAGSG